jgi:hypothetical protein
MTLYHVVPSAASRTTEDTAASTALDMVHRTMSSQAAIGIAAQQAQQAAHASGQADTEDKAVSTAVQQTDGRVRTKDGGRDG